MSAPSEVLSLVEEHRQRPILGRLIASDLRSFQPAIELPFREAAIKDANRDGAILFLDDLRCGPEPAVGVDQTGQALHQDLFA